MKNINILILILMNLILTYDFVHAGSSANVKKGIQAYQQGKYEDSMKSFIDAQLERPELPALYYNIGSAAYKKQDYEAALNNFTRAKENLKGSKDEQANLLKEKSIFNLGNTKYRMGDLEGAVKELEQIPKTSTIYNEAKENIEFVKKKIEEHKKEDNKDKENQDNKDKENQDNKEQDKEKQGQQNKKEQNQSKEGQEKDKQEEQKKEGREDQQQSQKDKEEQQGANQEDKNKQDKDKQRQNIEQNKPQNSNQGEQKTVGNSKDGSRQHLLNRLEDKPGAVMMPEYKEQKILRDW